jgi:hypothetical protein
MFKTYTTNRITDKYVRNIYCKTMNVVGRILLHFLEK